MRRASKHFIAIVIASLFMAVVALPSSVKQKLPIGSWVKAQKITLGLDLQGGTQLDYRIDLSAVKAKNSDKDSKNDVRESDIIEGVRSTIERRVNGLGVSEPQIYISSVGDEKHIIVELAGIKDVDEARKVVGKTIQLEFKEKRGPGETDESAALMRKRAKEVLADALKRNSNFTKIGNSVRTGDKKIDFRNNKTYWESELPARYKNILSKLKAGQVYRKVLEGSDGYVVSGGGSLSQRLGAYVTQLVKKEKKERTVETKEDFVKVAREVSGKSKVTLNGKKRSDFNVRAGDAIWSTPVGSTTDVIKVGDQYRAYNVLRRTDDTSKIRASHILVAYKGAQRASGKVTRSKKEAEKEAEKLDKQARKNPGAFADLAKKYSDGPSASKGGDLGFFGRGMMTKSFEDAAYAMSVGDISNVVETEFGFHIIKLTDQKESASVADVEVMTSNNLKAIKTALKRTQSHETTRKETQYTINEIYFNTTPDPWKPTGLDGSHFKFASVAYDRIGTPQVSIEFDSEGALLFEKITGRLVNQPLAIFVGGALISAPNVQQKITGGNAVITGNYSLKEALQLANDLNTGAIDAPILLSGQTTISATLGQNALNVSLMGGLIGLIVVAIFMILYYRLLGVFAVLALMIYAIIILFVLNVFPIVMTLAGIAGIILSVGMAVDANILIFERTREELNEGKAFSAAVAAGFDRAWASIRDSNVSTLITCAILWSFGNSIIRGFALTLALGVLVSMFTAITVTRAFLRIAIGSRLTKNHFLLGTKKVE